MTNLKSEAIALISNIPDEKMATVVKLLENVCELLNVDSNRQERLTAHVEEKLALMEEAENFVGEDDAKETT